MTTVPVPREVFRLLAVKSYQLRKERIRCVYPKHRDYLVTATERIEQIVNNHSRVADKTLMVTTEFLHDLRNHFHSLHSMLKSFPVSPPKDKAWMFLLCNQAMKILDEHLQLDLFKQP